MRANLKGDLDNNIVKMMRYAAAALSVVSFMTTLNGMSGIVTNSIWISTLISFGIQAIILVMGLWFIPALKTIGTSSSIDIFAIKIVQVLMIALYICAIAFSSFFSYVYISNSAYIGVRSVDYNTELELFLVEKTRRLDNYNNEIYNMLLRRIRNIAPSFRSILDDQKKEANNEINRIKGNVTKYSVSKIPLENRATLEGIRNAYEGLAGNQQASDQMISDLERIVNQLNRYADEYQNIYYPDYEGYYDAFKKEFSYDEIDIRKANIDREIELINDQIELLSGYSHRYASVTAYMKSIINDFASKYSRLLNALEELKQGYDEVAANSDIAQAEDLTLQDFYSVIYSSDVFALEDLDKVREDLQRISTSFIQSSENIDEEKLSSLIACIEYLDRLNQARKLEERIREYETNNLSRTYLIKQWKEPDKTNGNGENESSEGTNKALRAQESTNVTSELNSLEGVEYVNVDSWNALRHADITAFISLVKDVPDIQYLIRQAGVANEILGDESSNDVILLQKIEKDISEMLKNAYQYSRDKLENISEMERAWNYLKSENNFLAWACVFIAFFLDISSFLIGLYMNAVERKRTRHLPSK